MLCELFVFTIFKGIEHDVFLQNSLSNLNAILYLYAHFYHLTLFRLKDIRVTVRRFAFTMSLLVRISKNIYIFEPYSSNQGFLCLMMSVARTTANTCIAYQLLHSTYLVGKQ